VPITRWTKEAIRKIPEIASRTIKGFVQAQLPELLQCASSTRLCWYTDSYDNHFVIDFVPDKKGLMVATGGSGHGFKFLPNLGEHVVDRIEGKKNDFLQYWNWRTHEAGTRRYNSIMEGVSSARSLHQQPLVDLDRSAVQLSKL
jgi:sarcosine oxidase/L-pipecolate oxidase